MDTMHDDSRKNITRRQFLGQTGVTLSGLTIAASAAAGDGQKKPLVGSGEHTYEAVHDWLMPPSQIQWGDTHGVAQDARGRIYVAHTVHPSSPSGDAIVVFDKDGKFLTSWGARFRGGAHGIDLRKEGKEEFLYHCDMKNRLVVKTTLDGSVVWEKGAPAEAGVYKEGARFVPTNVAFGPNGDFYVADGYGSHWVHQYSIRGEYLRTFGGKGTEPGKFQTPHGIWVDTRRKEPALVVTDRENHRLQWLTFDGKHIETAADGMRRPCNFDVRGDLAVVPDISSVVTLLDRDNKVVAQLGDGHPSKLRRAPRGEWLPGKFIHPHDALFLQNGDILVAEWVPIGRITLLRKVG
jgi:DNA-binding beta-propeller fold protein YncE